jgi:2'-5' RNA ligase
LATHTHGHHHPHLSYAVLREWELEAVRTALASLPDGGPFPVTVQGATVFPRGRSALAVAVPAEIMRRQQAVAECVRAAGAELHRHYLPGAWIPHISVATAASGELLPLAVTAISDVLPLTLAVTRAALVDSSTGETWPLPGIP